jgi:hypothetical protein
MILRGPGGRLRWEYDTNGKDADPRRSQGPLPYGKIRRTLHYEWISEFTLSSPRGMRSCSDFLPNSTAHKYQASWPFANFDDPANS